jgi:hypothetical protein
MSGTTNSPIGWNVKADQPYATETQAAADLANPDRKSYMALPTLIGAQAQHSVDNSNYADQLAQQRMFAYHQVAAKIAENNAKNAVDVMRLGNDNPGAIGLAANNPATAGSFTGMDPNAAGLFNDWSSRVNAAKIADSLGKGAQGFLAGGIQMPPGYASGVLPGNPAMTLGDPPIVAAAKVKEAGANARTDSGGGGGAEVTLHTPDADIKFKKQTEQGSYDILDRYKNRKGGGGDGTQPSHVGNAVPDPPMAQRDTPSSRSAAPELAPPNVTSHVQAGIEQKKASLPQGMYADAAGRPVQKDGSGYFITGKSGKRWPIQ